MAKGRLRESPGFGSLVRDISKLLRRRFERKALGLGLTHAQWLVIYHLTHHEGINQATLAEMMDIEPITLVGLLDRLEQAGWVERRHDPGDRRQRLLHLTKRVQPVLQKMQAIESEVRQEAFAGLSARDQQQIINAFHKVKGNLTDRKGFSEAVCKR